jgi:alpha-beta hydrolase superfamily lysophospholipase
VIGFDYKGFGRSDGVRGLIESTQGFIDDGVHFISKSKEHYLTLYPDKKFNFISYGLSMGGALCLAVDRSLPEAERFKAHLLVVANMGLASS